MKSVNVKSSIDQILKMRLANQRLAGEPFAHPAQAVAWLGAAQAQDYAAARWALALRCNDLTEADIDRAFDAGDILRTHMLRPTWHFVAPQDLRWMQALTSHHVQAANASIYRRRSFDAATFRRSRAVIEKALSGGKQLTRTELAAELQRAGIVTGDNLHVIYMLMDAELEGVVCSGARVGKQHTYALLDERVPAGRRLERDEALVELARRYFTSHGPATAKDFSRWSGLAAAETKKGLEMLGDALEHVEVEGQTYWFAPGSAAAGVALPRVLLLTVYDEYVIGYGDHEDLFDEAHLDKLDARGSFMAQYTILVNGRVAGTWKRTLKKDSVLIETSPFEPLSAADQAAVGEAAEGYAAFIGKAAVLA